jgi:hypothetical protein
MERAPSQLLPQTIWSVERWTVRNKLGEGVNKLGSTGSSVMVGRNVGVSVGSGVSVMSGVPLGGVVVNSSVLSTNRSGVNVGSNEKGVAVRAGGGVGVGVPRNGIETGSPLQPERRKIRIRTGFNFFI